MVNAWLKSWIWILLLLPASIVCAAPNPGMDNTDRAVPYCGQLVLRGKQGSGFLSGGDSERGHPY